jgi:hypothetical protein
MTRSLAYVSAALLALMLASCSPAAPTPTPTASPATEPTAEPTPTEDADGPPASGDLELTTEGLGTIEIGAEPPAGNDPTSMLVFDPDFCTDEQTGLDLGIDAGSNAAGLWLPVEQYRSEESPGFVDAPFGVGVWDGAIQRIEVEDGEDPIATDAGITFGSTAADIAAAYKDVERVPMGLTTLHVVNGTAGKLVFEVATEDENIPDYWEAGMLGTVVLLRTIAAGEDLYSTAGSGNVVNSCPA